MSKGSSDEPRAFVTNLVEALDNEDVRVSKPPVARQ